MKLYFLVEGEETEVALYPFWFSKMVPLITKVDSFSQITENTFYVVSGYGYPAMLDNNNVLNSIKEVNNDGSFDYLVICLDCDHFGIEGRIFQIQKYLQDNNLSLLGNCQLVLIIQNPCIETWLLGTRMFYPTLVRNKNFIQHQQHYDVSINDPELMPLNPNFKLPISRYHFVHLHEMLKPTIRYSKSNPRGVKTDVYFESMLKRLQDEPNQLNSFRDFIQFCNTINAQVN